MEAERETLEDCYEKDDDSAGYTDLSQFHGNDEDEQQKPPNDRAEMSVRLHRPVRSDFGVGA